MPSTASATRRSSSSRTSPASSTCRARRSGCPTRSTCAEVGGAPRRAPASDEPRGLRDRALLELLYASGLRISEALGLDRQDLSLEGGFVRVIGKGDKERMVPVGDVALDALSRYLDERDRPPGSAATTPRRRAAVRSSSRRAAGASVGWPPGASIQDAAASGHLAGHVTPHTLRHSFRDAPAGGRRGPAGRPGTARSCEYHDHPALHPPDGRADQTGLRARPSARLTAGKRKVDGTYAESLLTAREGAAARASAPHRAHPRQLAGHHPLGGRDHPALVRLASCPARSSASTSSARDTWFATSAPR